MTVTPLSPRGRARAPRAVPPTPPAVVKPGRDRAESAPFVRFLIEDGVLSPSPGLVALAREPRSAAELTSLLLAKGLLSADRLARASARFHGLPFVDPACDLPDIRLVDRLGAAACLRRGLLPWRVVGGETVVLCDDPQGPRRHARAMTEIFGPVRFALCRRSALDSAVTELRGTDLRRAAETMTPPQDSCRSMVLRWSGWWLAVTLAALALAAAAAPVALFVAVTLLAGLAMIGGIALKLVALLSSLRPIPPPAARPAVIARLPVVSILVPLLNEADIAPRLVLRLARLEYPRDLLDVILVVEEADRATRASLARKPLPSWMRIVIVPQGGLRTKPMALNHALGFCRGSVIGVYDAEDAPDPHQINAMVERFHQRDGRVACLQGMLDFYNPTTNWLARCFTLEYATWFRVILPGLQRLGVPVPLGGTTLFFRRDALEALGGWDAHNVTEDADLGIRLHRHGYRTEVVASVTREEANCHSLPWVRQRSRWIKGYMMTWRVHMRDPRQLWRDLGPRGFAGFQVLILGSVLHALLAPFLLSFWIVFAGWHHPIVDGLSQGAFLGLFGLFLTCEAISLSTGYIALRKSGHKINPVWLLALNIYHPMASLAALKAIYEMARNPFYWDKTRHGRHDPINEA